MANKLTTEEFKNRVYSIVGKEYTVLGDYKNTKTKILIKHNYEKCGNHEYYVTPKGFLRGNRCPKCNDMKKGKKSKTTSQFKEELYSLVGDEYILMGDYKGVFNKVKLLHKKCNNIWEVTPNKFISSHSRCKFCSIKEHNINQRKTHSYFKQEIKNKYGNDYEILTKYVNSKTKVKVKHKCGNEWYIRPSHLLERDMCPRCKMSIGEKHIINYLESNNINYKQQKKFENLKYKRKLSYDFYLPDYNLLIEYQGLQHYQPINNFNGEEGYKEQVIKDNIKRKYAKDNNYNLLEISYKYKYYNTIKELLDNKLLT